MAITLTYVGDLKSIENQWRFQFSHYRFICPAVIIEEGIAAAQAG